MFVRWYGYGVIYDTYWLGRLQPHSLDSLVASLPRGSLGAQPLGVTRPNQKRGEGKALTTPPSHVGDPHTRGGRTWTSSGSGMGSDCMRYSIC
jgi:hypothetical protein